MRQAKLIYRQKVWKRSRNNAGHPQHTILLLGFTGTNREKLQDFLERLRREWNIPDKLFSRIVLSISGAVHEVIAENKSGIVSCVFVSARNEPGMFRFSIEDGGDGFDHAGTATARIWCEPAKSSELVMAACLSDTLYFSGYGSCLNLGFVKRK
jgi:hypothetical protein